MGTEDAVVGQQADADGPEWVIDGQIYTPEDIFGKLKAQSNAIKALEDEIAARDERIDELEQKITQLVVDTDAQWEDIQELQNRTNLLGLLEDVDELDTDQMRGAILLHMQSMVGDDNPRYAMDWDKTNEILHDPDVHRTTINGWMSDAADAVGDDTVCWYEGGQRGPNGQPARIVVDIQAADATVLNPEDCGDAVTRPNNRR